MLFFSTDTGRLWVKRAILFIVVLLGLKWAIAEGVKEGTGEIQKSLAEIRIELIDLDGIEIGLGAIEGQINDVHSALRDISYGISLE